MEIKDILLGGGGVLLVIMTIIQIAPIKINPWSALARWIGRAINAEVLSDLDKVKNRLDNHIATDNERHADYYRSRILRFNNELLREIRHSKEDFTEILTVIDRYEEYSEKHPEYRNNRAVHAISNIERVYDSLLETNGFL